MEKEIIDCLYPQAKLDLENITEVETVNSNQCKTSTSASLVASDIYRCSGIILYNGETFALAHILENVLPQAILDDIITNFKKNSKLIQKKVRAAVLVGPKFAEMQSYIVSKDIKPFENNYFFPTRIKGEYQKRDVIVFPKTNQIKVYHENNFEKIKLE